MMAAVMIMIEVYGDGSGNGDSDDCDGHCDDRASSRALRCSDRFPRGQRVAV